MSQHTSSGPGADLILIGGTVVPMDAAGRRHQGLAVRDGRVTALGTSREMQQLAGPDTEVVDLAGGTVLPGFIETHAHPPMLGERLAQLDASSPANTTIADIVERVRDAVAGRAGDEWLVGAGYDDTALRDHRHPNRHDLDAVAPDSPVVLHHISGHVAVVNSHALRLMGMTADTPDPAGGEIQTASSISRWAGRTSWTRSLPSVCCRRCSSNTSGTGETGTATSS
ncbi:MAG: amidohydrolase family protein, partial [Propionibacterium sp.]|nr:amidohydrolase family protein [Propionibacterium sp.]